jgi:hypothetical protein
MTIAKSARIGVAAGLLGAGQFAAAQTAPPPKRPNCSAPEHHQLDFWVGAWSVTDTVKGYPVGSSRIEPVMNGCAIRESYDAPAAPGGAYSGTSYSGFDRKDGKWHQFYVDTNGNATWYSGELEGPDMVLVAPGRSGALQRMTYHPLAGGAVEQIGVISTDSGKTWQPGYDYTYRPKQVPTN